LDTVFKVYRVIKLDKEKGSLTLIQTPAVSLPTTKNGMVILAIAYAGCKIMAIPHFSWFEEQSGYRNCSGTLVCEIAPRELRESQIILKIEGSPSLFVV